MLPLPQLKQLGDARRRTARMKPPLERADNALNRLPICPQRTFLDLHYRVFTSAPSTIHLLVNECPVFQATVASTSSHLATNGSRNMPNLTRSVSDYSEKVRVAMGCKAISLEKRWWCLFYPSPISSRLPTDIA